MYYHLPLTPRLKFTCVLSNMNLTHKIAGFSSIYKMVYSHSRKLFEAAVQSQNPTVILVFSEAAAKCDSSVGFNSLFGPKYCRFYWWHWHTLYVKFDYVEVWLMGFPWRNWTILPFLSVLFIFLVHYTYYTLCLLWHVIHDNNNNIAVDFVGSWFNGT